MRIHRQALVPFAADEHGKASSKKMLLEVVLLGECPLRHSSRGLKQSYNLTPLGSTASLFHHVVLRLMIQEQRTKTSLLLQDLLFRALTDQ